MRFAAAARAFGLILTLSVYTAATADEPASPSTGVVDVMPAFWNVVDNSADSQQFIARFRKEVVERYAIFSHEQFKKNLTDENLALYYESVQTDLPTMRALSGQVHTQAAAASKRFAEVFPGFNSDVSITYLPSFYRFDGQLTRIDGEFALLFGVDGIARYHGANADLGVLLSHELFHVHHARTSPALFADEEHNPVYAGVWIEGLATYVSERLNPQASTLQILLDDTALHTRAPPKLRSIIEEILAQFDSASPDTYDRFLNYGDKGDIPGRTGYLAGYLAAKELGATRTLAELASLRGDALRDSLRAALRTIADDAAKMKIE